MKHESTVKQDAANALRRFRTEAKRLDILAADVATGNGSAEHPNMIRQSIANLTTAFYEYTSYQHVLETP